MPLLRTPALRPMVAIITSPDMIGCYTHFFGGRTVPHDDQNCLACSRGVPSRWHGYVSARDTKTALHYMFEFTAQAAEAFQTYKQANGTLRGCKFQATRRDKRVNGRVIIQTKTADLTLENLPQPPILAAVMATIWSLPQSTVKADHQIKGHPAVSVDHEAAHQILHGTPSILLDGHKIPTAVADYRSAALLPPSQRLDTDDPKKNGRHPDHPVLK